MRPGVARWRAGASRTHRPIAPAGIDTFDIAGMWVGTCRYITYYDSDPTNTHNSVTTVLSRRAVAVFRSRE